MIAYADNVTLADVRVANTTIFETNAPPVLADIPFQITDQLVRLTFTVTATDPDTPANMLVYSLEGNIPEGASINSTTGVFSWTPSRNQSGYYPIIVAVDDGADDLIYQTVDVVVRHPDAPDFVYGASSSHRCWTQEAFNAFVNDYPTWGPDIFQSRFMSEPLGKYKNIGESVCKPTCRGDLLTNVRVGNNVGFDMAVEETNYGSKAGVTYTKDKTFGVISNSKSKLGWFSWTPNSGDIKRHTIKFTANDSGYTCTAEATIDVYPSSFETPPQSSPPIISKLIQTDTAYTGHMYATTVGVNQGDLTFDVSIARSDTKPNTEPKPIPVKPTITIIDNKETLTWDIPRKSDDNDYTGIYDITVTAKKGNEKSPSKTLTLTVRENNIPVLTVRHGDNGKLVENTDVKEIMRYAGTFFQARYHLMGSDGDSDQTFTLSVSDPPTVFGGALTDCKDEGVTIHQKGSVISSGTTSPLTGAVCVIGLNTEVKTGIDPYKSYSDRFTIGLSDGWDTVVQTMEFKIIDGIAFGVEAVSDFVDPASNIVKRSGFIVTIAANALPFVDPITRDYVTLVWRCDHNYLRPEPDYDDEARCAAKPDMERDGTRGFSGQSETREPQWILIANISNTANITIHDTNIEPDHTYSYVARIFAGNKSSDYIPLGNVTTPADGPPVITLKGSSTMTILLGTPYVEPGYTAFDDYDGNVTDDMTVSNSVDVNREGNYNIFYYASDSAGNLATPQKRIVFVIDDSTPPVLTLKGSKTISMDAGLTYTDPGYSAIDNKDGNITDNVVVTGTVNTRVPDVYTIQYDVSDRVGNKAPTQTRTVTIIGDDTPPVITLKGDKTISIEAGLTYVDPGYMATDNRDGNITDMVVITGTVDTNTPGTYTIQYDVLDSSSNAAIQQIRTVTVVDTIPPTLTLKGGSSITIPASTPYVEPGYTATDNIDGNVRVEIVGWVNTNRVGSYSLQYTAYDSSGNSAPPQIRMIIVEDVTPPVITLKGNSSITVPASIPYVDPGYTAIDNIDGDITGRVVISGMVDTDTLGDYTIYYDVSDGARNAAIQQSRTVTVADLTPPVITLKGGDSITVPASVPYVDPGYTAIDNIDGNITESVVITGHIDTDVPGTYTLHYDVWDAAFNIPPTQNRTIIVADMTPPTITLKGNATVTIPMGPTYTDPGYTATDNIDGDITSMVTVSGTVNPLIPGMYTISYTVTDTAGNNKQQDRVVTVSPPTDTTQYCNSMTLAQLMASGKYNIINKMFSSDSNIKGTNKADLIIVGNNGPTIEGKDGDDCIIGGTGNDTILGHAGNDMMFGNGGNDEIRGGDNKDIIHGGAGNDELHGGSGHDTIHGEGGADEIHGGAGNDTIYGGSEDDKILGLGGNDTIYGEAGNDTIYAGSGNDTIYGGPGTDTIEADKADTVHDDA